MKLVLIALCVVFAFVRNSEGYKILGVFSTTFKSHYIVGSALMKGLAEKGHEVTVISAFPQKTSIKNYNDISNEGVIQHTKDLTSAILGINNQNVFENCLRIFELGRVMTNYTLSNENVQNLMKSNVKFDLVIMEVFLNAPLLGLGHVFNAPVIGLSPFGASPDTNDMVGSPSPLSYVPNIFVPLTDRMNLFERMQNIFMEAFGRFFFYLFSFPKQEAIYNAVFSDPKPTLHELQRRLSLVLLNTHVTLSYPRPYVPNMIEVGGMHINHQTKPLPDDIRRFIESAKNGVIYFSMGSNLNGTQLPIKKREAILKAFSSFKVKVIWKFEDVNMPGKTDNIMIRDWLPQNDILAHPNVKLFITHGGLLSTTEAVYFGVPIIGIPMFADQHWNMARAVDAGYGLIVDYNELSDAFLKKTINEVLENPKYRSNMNAVSKRYRDQPQTPLETAMYWVEYVIRHKGAHHLHSTGVDLSFIEYHNIDAFVILFGGIFLIVYIFVTLLKKVCCSSRGGQKSKKHLKRKKTN